METKDLNKTLRDRARELGLCDQWYKEWDKNSTRQELIDKYLNGIDFCIANDYPNIVFIKEYFPDSLLRKNEIYLNCTAEVKNARKVVLLGESKVNAVVEGMASSDIYVRHGSELNVVATDGARVFVEMYEDSKVKAVADAESKIFIYQHGGHAEGGRNVNIRDKRKAGI